MAKVFSLFIHGDVIAWQDSSAEDWGGVNLRGVTRQIQDAKDSGADTLDVHIHSNGGDVNEGFAIHDALINSGLSINTIVDGNCFSIATVMFLAGSKRSVSKNAQLMIHNPWGFTGGTADDIEKYADTVRDAENKILDFYVLKTGSDRDSLKAMMDEETYIKADSAVELKFATDILEPVMAKAKAIRHGLKKLGTNPNENKASAVVLNAPMQLLPHAEAEKEAKEVIEELENSSSTSAQVHVTLHEIVDIKSNSEQPNDNTNPTKLPFE